MRPFYMSDSFKTHIDVFYLLTLSQTLLILTLQSQCCCYAQSLKEQTEAQGHRMTMWKHSYDKGPPLGHVFSDLESTGL